MTTETLDPVKLEEFVGQVVGQYSGATSVILAAIGDKLGLFKDLAANGAATSVELAKRTGTSERYIREWLGGMATAGYLDYDASSKSFSINPEQEQVFAVEAGPAFFGGAFQMFLDMPKVSDQLVESFRKGGGVPQSAFPETFYENMDRFTAGWHENHLLQEWIPAADGVVAALERGIDVADVGCGQGRALVKMAQAFPKSRYVGYDIYAPNVKKANARAREAGVADQVKFVEADVSKGLPDTYDLITTFDVIHDAADPQGLLTTIRKALRTGGSYLCLDINCSDKLEENMGPLGAMFHGFSVLYCMTTSLANGGAGLGTLGLHEPKLQELSKAAGFSGCVKLALEDPFNNLYQLKP